MRETLEAKVKATNIANAKANELYTVLAPIIANWEGHDILKVDGTLKLKYANQLPEFPFNPSLRITRDNTKYSLSFSVSACVNIEGQPTCLYVNATTYLAKVSNGVVGEICPPTALPTDYNADAIEMARNEYKAAQAVADELKYKFYPFGEYDR